MKTQGRYIQFPISLLRDFYDDRNAVIDKIFSFGIYYYSKRVKYDLTDVARQLIYDYYNKKLGTQLMKTISAIQWDSFSHNLDHKGFAGNGNFEPADEFNELSAYLTGDGNLQNLAIEHYKMRMALNSLNVKGDIEYFLKIGKQIEKNIHEKEPLPMVNLDHLFYFYRNEKNEFEITQLLAFIAIKSILGEKRYCKTNKELVLSRMFGYSSPSKMTDIHPELYKKYSKRYHFDRLSKELQAHWNVVIYGFHLRGFYVCIGNKMTLEELVEIAESSKTPNRIALIKKREVEAREKLRIGYNKTS